MKVSKHYCNLCGKKMDMWDVQEGFGFNGNIGYGSKYDGEKLNLDLCCDCMDKLIESCVIAFKNSPFFCSLSDSNKLPNFKYNVKPSSLVSLRIVKNSPKVIGGIAIFVKCGIATGVLVIKTIKGSVKFKGKGYL